MRAERLGQMEHDHIRRPRWARGSCTSKVSVHFAPAAALRALAPARQAKGGPLKPTLSNALGLRGTDALAAERVQTGSKKLLSIRNLRNSLMGRRTMPIWGFCYRRKQYSRSKRSIERWRRYFAERRAIEFDNVKYSKQYSTDKWWRDICLFWSTSSYEKHYG